MKGMIFDIQRSSFVDGDGVRTAVFFKGCNLKCKWCHNPEGIDSHRQIMFYPGRCVGCNRCLGVCRKGEGECTLCGKCAEYCPSKAKETCGREYGEDELYEIIARDKDLYLETGGGVTFSGGECMLQIDFLLDLMKKCKEQGIHTAIDTAGCVPFENFEKILPYADLFLYDIKTTDPIKHLEYTGQKNELILNNLKKLLKTKSQIWIRPASISPPR